MWALGKSYHVWIGKNNGHGGFFASSLNFQPKQVTTGAITVNNIWFRLI